MAVFGLPILIPFIFALCIAIYWRYSWKAPVNNWLVCLLVFCVNFFWFAYAFIIFLILAIYKLGVFNSLKRNDGSEPTK